jgi:SAM-dependent methyltransferase
MSEQSHRSDPRVLNRRTLERDHRLLPAMLCPGMSVLDVGCGTGAITAGIARAVGPAGRVVGVDRDESLLAGALEQHVGVPGLDFVRRDALELDYDGEFDLVTAARVLQWIADPRRAVEHMAAAAKPGGMVVALDYNHERNSWIPEPPRDFALFYAAFLEWRTSNGWDNRIVEHLPGMFEAAGLVEVVSVDCDQVAVRGEADFEEASEIWAHVIESIGSKFLDESARARATAAFDPYRKSILERHTLSMRTIIGKRIG